MRAPPAPRLRHLRHLRLQRPCFRRASSAVAGPLAHATDRWLWRRRRRRRRRARRSIYCDSLAPNGGVAAVGRREPRVDDHVLGVEGRDPAGEARLRPVARDVARGVRGHHRLRRRLHLAPLRERPHVLRVQGIHHRLHLLLRLTAARALGKRQRRRRRHVDRHGVGRDRLARWAVELRGERARERERHIGQILGRERGERRVENPVNGVFPHPVSALACPKML